MPSFIIKPKRDEDFYVEWSTVVDAPTFWGDREAMSNRFISRPQAGDDGKRMERADAKGSSCAGDIADWYTFDDRTFIWAQMGILDRDDLKPACDLMDAGHQYDGPEIAKLLTPFEDDSEPTS